MGRKAVHVIHTDEKLCIESNKDWGYEKLYRANETRLGRQYSDEESSDESD